MGSTSTRLSATYGQQINVFSDCNVIRYTRSLKHKGGKYRKIYKIFRAKDGVVMLKECKTKECQSSLRHLQLKE